MNTNAKIFTSALLLVVPGGILIASALTVSPMMFSLPSPRPGCDEPIRYRIDTIDPRFPLEERAFRQAVFEAEAVWERGIGKDLFLYDPTALLSIRTEFDDRQKMTYEAQDLEKKVSEYENDSKKLEREYNSLVAQYEAGNEKIKQRVAEYEKQLRKYNREVERWNASGGAPEDTYADLKKEQEELKKEAKDLDADSAEANLLAEKINALAAKLNQHNNAINQNIDTFRSRYGEPKPFVQGLYDGNIPSITIFQFEEEDDLRLVLAHELGHALGVVEHIPGNVSAIMYALMGGQDLKNPSLSPEDITAFSEVCPDRNPEKTERVVRYLVHTPKDSFRFEDFIAILAD